MKQSQRFILALVGLGTIALSFSLKSSWAQSLSKVKVSYQTFERSHSTVHVVTIPHNGNYVVTPQIAGSLQPLTELVDESAVAAINGGYFDPVNQKTTSFIVQNSLLVADPRFNERLVDNPDLKQYLRKIFNRAEFRAYNCQSGIEYDIQSHSSPIPPNCTLMSSLGGGPGLIPQDNSLVEGFTDYQDGKKVRDAIGSDRLNARSAVGITKNQDVMFVMVAQKSENPKNSGMSLAELGEVLTNLGAVKAMNLDGGSSSALYYQGETVYGRVDQDGKEIQRPIKSILSVIKPSITDQSLNNEE
ncbi:MAG: phosphodiester glycosidase family protein [Cyanobacteria bacterium J06621_8]